MALSWWPFANAGTYPGAVTLQPGADGTVTLNVPADAQPGQTIHLIAEGHDTGTPMLTGYARVVLTLDQ